MGPEQKCGLLHKGKNIVFNTFFHFLLLTGTPSYNTLPSTYAYTLHYYCLLAIFFIKYMTNFGICMFNIVVYKNDQNAELLWQVNHLNYIKGVAVWFRGTTDTVVCGVRFGAKNYERKKKKKKGGVWGSFLFLVPSLFFHLPFFANPEIFAAPQLSERLEQVSDTDFKKENISNFSFDINININIEVLHHPDCCPDL